jgi:hypothetical protein
MKMSILQRFHWLITISLALLLLVETVILLSFMWHYQTYTNGRPQGLEIRLSKDYPVFGLKSSIPVFTLPSGTVVQDSTPYGAATLGKGHDPEYLLMIRSQKPVNFDPDHPGIDPDHPSLNDWSDNYSFTPNDSGM